MLRKLIYNIYIYYENPLSKNHIHPLWSQFFCSQFIVLFLVLTILNDKFNDHGGFCENSFLFGFVRDEIEIL